MAAHSDTTRKEIDKMRRSERNLILKFEQPRIECAVVPNPANEMITLNATQSGFSFVITDAQGRMVRQGECPMTAVMLDIAPLSPGCYGATFFREGKEKTVTFNIAR